MVEKSLLARWKPDPTDPFVLTVVISVAGGFLLSIVEELFALHKLQHETVKLTESLSEATHGVEAAVKAVDASVRAMDDATRRLQRTAIWVAVAIGLTSIGAVVLVAFIHA